MKRVIHYTTIEGKSLGYGAMLAILGLFIAIGLGSAYYMEHNGHWVTGMSDLVVWGMPHVFAVFLIVAASGALNVASIASVFHRAPYKPLARLSGLLAIALLVGGLCVLVLDLGRPDRLLVAMTTYNFKSIFAWNIYLYTGFIGVVGVYLWFMMEHKMNRYYKYAGFVAFIWRLTLTTGTGSIFGFIVARKAYDSAIMAPMFIIMSFSFGLAIYLLVLMASMGWTGRTLGTQLVLRLKNLLGIFVAAVLYFVAVYHVTNIYITAQHGIEKFILVDGGIYTHLFWYVQVLLGGFVPLALFYLPGLNRSRIAAGLGAALVIVGGMAQIYVIIIGGQAYPQSLFPGMIVHSSFFDGVVAHYQPSLPEVLLGIGGVCFSLGIVAFAIKVLPFLPDTLADDMVDPHHTRAAEEESEAETEAAPSAA